MVFVMATGILPPKAEPETDEVPPNHVHFRLWQIVISAATVVLTGWFFTLNPFAGIIAVFVAKHVLVAILAAGLAPPRRGR